jgi:hypothetical protein
MIQGDRSPVPATYSSEIEDLVADYQTTPPKKCDGESFRSPRPLSRRERDHVPLIVWPFPSDVSLAVWFDDNRSGIKPSLQAQAVVNHNGCAQRISQRRL